MLGFLFGVVFVLVFAVLFPSSFDDALRFTREVLSKIKNRLFNLGSEDTSGK